VRELGLSAGGHGWALPNRPAGEVLEVIARSVNVACCGLIRMLHSNDMMLRVFYFRIVLA
jgi:hypothetical protein